MGCCQRQAGPRDVVGLDAQAIDGAFWLDQRGSRAILEGQRWDSDSVAYGVHVEPRPCPVNPGRIMLTLSSGGCIKLIRVAGPAQFGLC